MGSVLRIEANKRLILRLTEQVVELGHKPVTLKEIKKEMEEEGSVRSVGSVEPAKKQRKEDKGQQKINTMFPKLAAHAGTTLLGSIIAVTLMLLKGVGASKK